jgi:2,4-dienoyl-CoA reductase-like NADH-dependent reductase (Old Yellow Enzyme family)
MRCTIYGLGDLAEAVHRKHEYKLSQLVHVGREPG